VVIEGGMSASSWMTLRTALDRPDQRIIALVREVGGG
jgi:hypothetical protein